MSEDSHPTEDHNTENVNKPFAKKFIFPVLILAVLFYVFTIMTNNKDHGEHGDGHNVGSTDGHVDVEGEHDDHEH